jgi:hypothetical protein
VNMFSNKIIAVLVLLALTTVNSQTIITLQSGASGEYVVVDPSTGILSVTGQQFQAAQFYVVAQSGSNVALQYVTNDLYVTANNAGASALVAGAHTPGTWEQFQFIAGTGSSKSILAVINNNFVTLQPGASQELIANTPNNGTTPPLTAQFFVASIAPTPVYSIQSVSNGNYIVVDPTTTELLATGTSTTASLFSIVSEGDVFSLHYGDVATGQYVSTNGGSTSPLTANRSTPRSWEYFSFITESSGDTSLLAYINNEFVTVQSDNTLLANGPNPGGPHTTPPESQFIFTLAN